MDKEQLARDLALLCVKRYLDEVKFSEDSDDLHASGGSDLAKKSIDAFRTFYTEIRHSPDLTSID